MNSPSLKILPIRFASQKRKEKKKKKVVTLGILVEASALFRSHWVSALVHLVKTNYDKASSPSHVTLLGKDQLYVTFLGNTNTKIMHPKA